MVRHTSKANSSCIFFQKITLNDLDTLTECWLAHFTESVTYIPAKFDEKKDRERLLVLLKQTLARLDSPAVALYHPTDVQVKQNSMRISMQIHFI